MSECDCKYLAVQVRYWTSDTEYVCEFDEVHSVSNGDSSL
jgi:hypothetical protein